MNAMYILAYLMGEGLCQPALLRFLVAHVDFSISLTCSTWGD